MVKLTSLSGRALFYKERTSLKHKVLAVAEGEGLTGAGYALRNLISAGELVAEVTVRDQSNGRLATMTNKVEGPTAVLLTTTDPETDPETKPRFIVTAMDESREQTLAVLAWQRRQQSREGLEHAAERQEVVRRHWALQRLMEPLSVVNPYAQQLRFGDDRLTSRRDQPKYLRLMAAVALLRQRQKTVRRLEGPVAKAYVEVDGEDVRLANALATELFGHSLDELSRPGYELLVLLDQMRREQPTADAFSFSAAMFGNSAGGRTRGCIGTCRSYWNWNMSGSNAPAAGTGTGCAGTEAVRMEGSSFLGCRLRRNPETFQGRFTFQKANEHGLRQSDR